MYFSEHPVLAPDLPAKSHKVYNTVFSPFPSCKATQAHRDQPKDPHLQEFYCITNMIPRDLDIVTKSQKQLTLLDMFLTIFTLISHCSTCSTHGWDRLWIND